MKEFKTIEDFTIMCASEKVISKEIESSIENHMKNYLTYTEEVKECK